MVFNTIQIYTTGVKMKNLSSKPSGKGETWIEENLYSRCGISIVWIITMFLFHPLF